MIFLFLRRSNSNEYSDGGGVNSSNIAERKHPWFEIDDISLSDDQEILKIIIDSDSWVKWEVGQEFFISDESGDNSQVFWDSVDAKSGSVNLERETVESKLGRTRDILLLKNLPRFSQVKITIKHQGESKSKIFDKTTMRAIK